MALDFEPCCVDCIYGRRRARDPVRCGRLAVVGCRSGALRARMVPGMAPGTLPAPIRLQEDVAAGPIGTPARPASAGATATPPSV